MPKEKPNDNNPNNFSSIKLTRKKRTDVALLLSDANQTFPPTSLNSSPGANCSSLNVTNPKTRKRLKCVHSRIKSTDFQTASGHNTIQNFRQPFHICVSKVYLYLTRQYNLILLLRATKLVLSTKIILNYTFSTKYDKNAKLPNTQPTVYPT